MIKKIIKKLKRLSLFPFILKDYLNFSRLDQSNPRFKTSFFDFYPCRGDKTSKTSFDSHYIYHTAWAARKVKEINPAKHLDISSSLYFSGIVSAFLPWEFYDYRPADLKLSNLKTGAADLTRLDFLDNSIFSLSCMHTVEHIGLGRYGDTINPAGDLQAINELKRVLAKGGSLLFVVPVGRPKIIYNAHRIYSFEMIQDYFQELKLQEFSLIDDQGNFLEGADPVLVKEQKYGCGCFWFIKQ